MTVSFTQGPAVARLSPLSGGGAGGNEDSDSHRRSGICFWNCRCRCSNYFLQYNTGFAFGRPGHRRPLRRGLYVSMAFFDGQYQFFRHCRRHRAELPTRPAERHHLLQAPSHLSDLWYCHDQCHNSQCPSFFASGVPLNPQTQAVNYNSPPIALSLTIPAAAASVRYQWQSASNPAFNGAAVISGANGSSYSPDSLSSTTYFRAILINNKDSSYSSPAIVTVYPALTAGMLSPASQTVAYDSLPGLLSCTGFSGGNGDFSFQWYSSPDGINWSPVPE